MSLSAKRGTLIRNATHKERDRERERKERAREKDLFETQSKEQVLSSDQLFKSIYSCFLIDVADVSTTRTKLSHVDGRERNREWRKRRMRRGEQVREQKKKKKKKNVISAQCRTISSEREREREGR